MEQLLYMTSLSSMHPPTYMHQTPINENANFQFSQPYFLILLKNEFISLVTYQSNFSMLIEILEKVIIKSL